MSVNDAWQGRRFKTPEYKKYEKIVLLMLPKKVVPKGKYKVLYEFGFSSQASDIDNPIKLIGDILQKKYKFNDKDIYEMQILKKIVPKGKEYFSFEIINIENQTKLLWNQIDYQF